MAGESATHLIWFAISIIVAGSIVGLFVGIAYNHSQAIRDHGRAEAADYYVDVELINDPSSVPYNDTTNSVSFYAKNTGRYDIPLDSVVMEIDGKAYAPEKLDMTVLGENDKWSSGTVARINITGIALTEGTDYTAWIEVQGITPGRESLGRGQDTLEFHIKVEG